MRNQAGNYLITNTYLKRVQSTSKRASKKIRFYANLLLYSWSPVELTPMINCNILSMLSTSPMNSPVIIRLNSTPSAALFSNKAEMQEQNVCNTCM